VNHVLLLILSVIFGNTYKLEPVYLSLVSTVKYVRARPSYIAPNNKLMHQLLPLSACHPTMAPMEHRKPSIEFIRSFYSGERKLFSRMASTLEIDGDLAFKIISYWLWLEENINKDVIYYIQSLSDDGLRRISSLGEQVLTNAAKSDSSTAQKALSGVDYFLKAVCRKAIDDLKDKTEYEKAKAALEELDLQVSFFVWM
jgi:hypothetical protein